ncbi:MAG TPA: low temperature requirement protein A [Ktedonobacteraceae bacterium]|nr:low temperature requirement protein A [Ktedonobacteraceae bacterium]
MAPTILKRALSLHMPSSRERQVEWLELFFDLVFVLAIAELAHYLHDHLTIIGSLSFIGLFVPIWWTWVCFSFYADQFDPGGIAYRLVMIGAMLLTIIMSVNVQGALSNHTPDFVMAFIGLQILLIILYILALRDTAARSQFARTLIGFVICIILWLGSLFVPSPIRYILWALGLLIEIAAPMVASLTLTSLRYYTSHIPERIGTFTLIVLGESIIQVGTGLGPTPTHWSALFIITAIGSFIIAACLWWLYFDRVDITAIHRGLTGGKWALVRTYLWSYAHFALFAGLTATSVGIALAIDETQANSLDTAARIALCLGVAVSLLTITLIQQLSPQPLSRSELLIRCGTAVVALALALLDLGLSSLIIVGILVLLFCIVMAFEMIRFQQTDNVVEEPAS